MSRSLVSIFLFLIFLLPVQLHAQISDHLGSYYSVYLEIPIAKQWSLFNENELRGVKVFNKFYYYELKAGLNYKYSKRLTFTMAMGVYSTYHGGSEYEDLKKKTDFRLWQQGNYKQRLFRGAIEHRARIEEVINGGFSPSVRYRLQPKWPLNKEELVAGAIFATAHDELFFQFKAPALKRNRIFGGFGYYFSANTSLQAGILTQTDYRLDATGFTKNFFYLSGSFRL